MIIIYINWLDCKFVTGDLQGINSLGPNNYIKRMRASLNNLQ